MFCKNCGRQIPDDAAFCPACGTKRSGGDTFGDERSGRDIKNLPSYAKENELNRSSDAIDSDGSSSACPIRAEEIQSLRQQPEEVQPVRVRTEKVQPVRQRQEFRRRHRPHHLEPRSRPAAEVPDRIRESAQRLRQDHISRRTGKQNGCRTGTTVRARTGSTYYKGRVRRKRKCRTVRGERFLQHIRFRRRKYRRRSGGTADRIREPAQGGGQNIQWGSDGDRNETKNSEFAGDPAEIESHLGFAVFTLLCCCQPTSILAILFAVLVSQEVKKGNYEQAQKYSNLAKLFCWISIGLSIFCGGISSIANMDEWRNAFNGTPLP